MEIGNGALCMGCGLHDGAFVILEHLQPAGNVAGVIGTRFQCQSKVGGKECSADLGDQLLACIAFIAP